MVRGQRMNPNQRPIPQAALEDENAVEMLRVWIAGRAIHCSMKIGMYQETTKIPEERAWGTILADVARHVARALDTSYAKDVTTSLDKIRDVFLKEIGSPTSDAKGGFVQRH
jgi:hypothetical protein